MLVYILTLPGVVTGVFKSDGIVDAVTSIGAPQARLVWVHNTESTYSKIVLNFIVILPVSFVVNLLLPRYRRFVARCSVGTCAAKVDPISPPCERPSIILSNRILTDRVVART